MSRFSVLAVASVPPPVAGQSVATTLLERALRSRQIDHAIVDLSRQFATGNRLAASLRRLAQVARLPVQVARASRRLAEPIVFYLQLGHSVRAMARDLPLLILARRRGWPIVVHVHGGGFREVFEAAPPVLRDALKRELASVARAVVLSETLRRMFDGLVAEERIAVVSNGTAPEIWRAASELRRRPPAGGLNVLFLSNLIEAKGYGLVLEAAWRSQERGAPHRFVIAGAATEWQTIDPRSYVRRFMLANVDVRGPVYGDDKLALLSAADVFALPTRMAEGQPIAILEAMQLGLPVITSATGGIPDVVRAPDNGEIVDPRSPTAFLDAVDRLSDRRRWAQVSAHNRETALELYDPDRHGAAMIEVLRSASERSVRSRPGQTR